MLEKHEKEKLARNKQKVMDVGCFPDVGCRGGIASWRSVRG